MHHPNAAGTPSVGEQQQQLSLPGGDQNFYGGYYAQGGAQSSARNTTNPAQQMATQALAERFPDTFRMMQMTGGF